MLCYSFVGLLHFMIGNSCLLESYTFLDLIMCKYSLVNEPFQTIGLANWVQWILY